MSIILEIIDKLVKIFLIRKMNQLKLVAAILWDKNKNPYCPSCEKGSLKYGTYGFLEEKGYYCNTCEKIYPLVNAIGEDLDPKDVLKIL